MGHITASSHKDTLIRGIISNPKIVAGIDSQSPDYDPKLSYTLLFRNIFPWHKVSEVQTRADTYILIAVSTRNINRKNTAFIERRISIMVVAHDSRMRLGDATRIDYIGEELTAMLHNSRDYGVGVMRIMSDDEFVLPSQHDYVCRELVFHVTDMPESLC